MDQTAVHTYLQDEYPEIIAEVGIDLYLITASVADVYLTRPTLGPEWANPLADYFLLRRAVRGLANRMRIGIDGDNYSLKDLFDNVNVLYLRAAPIVSWLVASVSGRGIGSIGIIGTLAAEGML